MNSSTGSLSALLFLCRAHFALSVARVLSVALSLIARSLSHALCRAHFALSLLRLSMARVLSGALTSRSLWRAFSLSRSLSHALSIALTSRPLFRAHSLAISLSLTSRSLSRDLSLAFSLSRSLSRDLSIALTSRPLRAHSLALSLSRAHFLALSVVCRIQII